MTIEDMESALNKAVDKLKSPPPHEGTAEQLPDGFYWYETTPWKKEETKCSVCRVSDNGVEFVGEDGYYLKSDIHGKFWKIERPTQ